MKRKAITGLKRFLKYFLPAAPAAFLLLPVKCLAVSSTNIFSLETGVLMDNNVTAAVKAPDRRSDTVYNLKLSGGRRFQLGLFDNLSAQLICEESVNRKYKGLTYLKSGVSASWAHKFGIGPLKPVLTVGGAVSGRNYLYDGFDERRYELNTKIKQLLSENVDIAAALNIESHRTKEPDYNGHSRTLNLTVGIAAPADARVELGYGTRRGDITWYSSSPATPEWNEVSNLFNMYYSRWYSRTQIISGTIIYPLSFDSSVYLDIERQNTTWARLSYPNDILKIGFNYSFY